MSASGTPEYVLLGKVSKPHGIRGEVKIYPYSGQPEQFVASYERLYLQCDDQTELLSRYTVERARVQGKQVLVALAECRDRNKAEALAGCQVYVAREDLPPLDEQEYYLHELIDKQLVDPDGRDLGTGKRIMVAGAQDQLVVEQEGREYLVPIVSAFIVGIEKDRVVLDLPPGLVELNG
jgi:16S rRNA processing protein RimM